MRNLRYSLYWMLVGLVCSVCAGEKAVNLWPRVVKFLTFSYGWWCSNLCVVAGGGLSMLLSLYWLSANCSINTFIQRRFQSPNGVNLTPHLWPLHVAIYSSIVQLCCLVLFRAAIPFLILLWAFPPAHHFYGAYIPTPSPTRTHTHLLTLTHMVTHTPHIYTCAS